MNNPLIIVDTRESRSKVPEYLEKYGADIQFVTLADGDYQISDDIIFERKSYSDLISSIIDGRLFNQSKDLSDNFKHPIILLEGKTEGGTYQTKINRQSIHGSLISICINHGIGIIPTNGASDTAKLILTAARQLQVSGKKIRTNTKKKPKSLKAQQLFILEAFPGVGPERASRLLKQYEGQPIINILKDVNNWNVPDSVKDKVKSILGDIIAI